MELFNERIPSEANTWAVMFYASWCGRCDKLLPVWDQVGDSYATAENIFVGKVDCSVHHSLCGRQLVGKYPVFVFYKNDYKVRFDIKGDKKVERTLENFIKWIDSNPQPIVEEIKEIEALDSNLITISPDNIADLEKGIWLVAFCAPWAKNCVPLAQDWEELSKHASFHVGIVDIAEYKEIASKFSIQSAPTIKMLHEGEIIDYWGGRSVQTYQTFVQRQIAERIPKELESIEEPICRIYSDVVELTVDNFEEITKGKHFFLMFYAPWCGFCEEVLPVWHELADDPAYNIGKIDAIAEAPLRFKFHVAGYPTLILLKEDGEKVRYRGDRTVALFSEFLDEALNPQESVHET